MDEEWVGWSLDYSSGTEIIEKLRGLERDDTEESGAGDAEKFIF